jgi:hypothetical protein
MDKLRLSILFFIILPMAFSCNAQNSDRDLFGVWNGERDGNEIIFKFNKDHTVVFSFRDEVSGSVITINGDFETDFSKRPIRLTIRNIPQLTHPLHTIIVFNRDNSLQIANFAPRWRLRPIAFNKNSSLILKKVKNPNSIPNL